MGENSTCEKSIAALLDHYEDGWNLFKKADDWDYPIRFKPGMNRPDLPQTWFGLADRVIGIIAHEECQLDTYPNKIEIVDTPEMLDALASHGMPISYPHWSFGKARAEADMRNRAGVGGKYYELVINSDPCLAYYMASNTKTMQMLTIAHASYGHNSFFKGNNLIRQFSKADENNRRPKPAQKIS